MPDSTPEPADFAVVCRPGDTVLFCMKSTYEPEQMKSFADRMKGKFPGVTVGYVCGVDGAVVYRPHENNPPA